MESVMGVLDLINWSLLLLFLGMAMVVIPLGLNAYVYAVTYRDRYREIEQVPPQPIAIVFGAGVWDDGSPTPMLADRVQAAIDLYKLGRVQKILMTGDNFRPDYDEVQAMSSYAEKQGVPLTDILLDRAGLSTYDSCYRAQTLFGIEQAVLITQRYHLPRAVYTGHQMGIKAVGLGTPDWGIFRTDSMTYYTFREFIAVVKALWQVQITRPKPRVIGPFEGGKSGE
ncbi:vancomycin high temperature exclusion protein [Oscillatoria sp. HE19RPO]|uniref:SanA/YdcF family protein n=1 Tax=Oscillatoria sp. HE19RPO TaxID=2954806 RepID=UPI0020C54962|nr:ElyC/SanA/YdcF family protein [Oscillatoria sp. HE19RPO]